MSTSSPVKTKFVTVDRAEYVALNLQFAAMEELLVYARSRIVSKDVTTDDYRLLDAPVVQRIDSLLRFVRKNEWNIQSSEPQPQSLRAKRQRLKQ